MMTKPYYKFRNEHFKSTVMKTTLKTSAFIGLTALSAFCYGNTAAQSLPKDSAPVPCDAKDSPSRHKQLASGNGRVVSVGHDGKLRCSADVTEWQSVYVPVDAFIRGVTFGDGKFVAVGGSYSSRTSIILTSSNGRRWTAERCPSRRVLHSVASGNGRFIAVGADGVILSSRNGYRWRAVNLGTEATLAAVAFGKGVFVAGGDDGLLLTSHDGLGWTPQESGTRLYIAQLTFQNDNFYAGSSMIRLISNDGIAWLPVPASETVADTASIMPVPKF